jgi:hypothetical protein
VSDDLKDKLIEAADELYSAISDSVILNQTDRLSDARDAYAAASNAYRASLIPRCGQTWRHLKTGHVVFIVSIGKTQDADEQRDMQDVVIYQHGGTYWTRLLTEFTDGRFMRVS